MILKEANLLLSGKKRRKKEHQMPLLDDVMA